MNSPKHLSIIAMTALCISIIALGLFSSCSKGDTGPPGPQGIAGDSGINGTANIISNVYTVTTTVVAGDTSSSWTSTGNPTYHWLAGFTDPNITANNLDMVEAYWSTSIGTGWSALPVSSLVNKGDEMSFRYNDDSVSFTYYTGGAPYTKYPGYPAISPGYATLLFKVIVIPPGLAANYPGVNWKNAAEVATLPEVKAALSK
jgi:hypothetical protein